MSDRTVFTDALATLGMILTNKPKDMCQRDAIHLAAEPVYAGMDLKPGDHVGFIRPGVVATKNYWSGYGQGEKEVKLLGIVDPFLTKKVEYGQKFWLIVYPRQISSLRHVWRHPDFYDTDEIRAKEIKKPGTKNHPAARAWMEAYAESVDIDYETLMDGAKAYLEHDDYISDGGKFEGVSVPEDFWNHYEAITGKVVSLENRGSFFSCSC